MGNCLRGSSKVVEEIERSYKASHVINDEKMEKKKKNKNKRVSFDLGEEGGDANKEGVVRIRVVVTQKELKQLLSLSSDCDKYSSVEELLRTMKKRSMKVGDGEVDRSWRPALESIPEDRN